MLIRVLIFLFILMFLGVMDVILLLAEKPLQIAPFTYTVRETNFKGLNEANNADVLIIGDRMALYLDKFLSPLKETLKNELKKEPVFTNLSRENEGIHRTLYRLKQLKKLPPIIVYHGASMEWFEEKFNPNDYKKILYNFERFENEKIISLIITFPQLSRLIYKKTDYFDLENLGKISSKKRESSFKSREIEYKFYNQELRELIDYVKSKKSNLIIITTPLNLLVAPKANCANSTTNSMVEIQQGIEQLLKDGDSKQAYVNALNLSKVTVANATSFYLLGMSAKMNADLPVAREALVKANVFDCQNWHGNSIYNAIMRTEANTSQVELIDFAKTIENAEMGTDQIFLDEIYPQNIYYAALIEELTTSIKKYLSLKKN